MPVNLSTAIGAYQQVAGSAGTPGMESRTATPGQSFSQMLSDVAGTVTDAGARSDKMSVQAVTGKADLNEVVMAVANADLALQSVVAVRDRVVQAYQEILRMPI